MSRQEAMQERLQEYVRELFVVEDAVLSSFQREAQAAGLPTIQVPPELGKLLAILVRATDARRILEIGTLGGYSTAWMARALPPGGRLITLEKDPRHADFAREFLERAGVSDRVEVVLGDAMETLPSLLGHGATGQFSASEGTMVDRGEDPQFDLLFIDADKESYPAYLDWGLRLVRPGGLIVADNVFRGGRVIEPSGDPLLQAVAEFNRHAAATPLLDAIMLPTRACEDGVLIAVVMEQE